MALPQNERRRVARATHIFDLGTDLLAGEILVRTPATTIGICRCVCYTWWSMLTCVEFVSAHNRRSQHGNNQRLLLIGKTSASSLPLLNNPDTGISDKVFPLPAPTVFRTFRVLTTLHGLVCGIVNRPRRFVIWNPTTQQSTTLPRTATRGGYKDPDDVVGLYFHPTPEYRLLHLKRRKGHLRAYIYSPTNEVWRRIASTKENSYSHVVPKWTHGTYLEGVLYFTVSTSNPVSTHVLTFDVQTEKLEEASMPPIPDDCNTTSLVNIGDHLHMLTESNYPFWNITLWKKGGSTWSQMWTLHNSQVSLQVTSLTYQPAERKLYLLNTSGHLHALDANSEGEISTEQLHVYNGLQGIFYHETLVTPTLQSLDYL